MSPVYFPNLFEKTLKLNKSLELKTKNGERGEGLTCLRKEMARRRYDSLAGEVPELVAADRNGVAFICDMRQQIEMICLKSSLVGR